MSKAPNPSLTAFKLHLLGKRGKITNICFSPFCLIIISFLLFFKGKIVYTIEDNTITEPVRLDHHINCLLANILKAISCSIVRSIFFYFDYNNFAK